MSKYPIETARLFLREWHAGDAEAMYGLNADSEVLRYTGDVPFASVEEARVFIEGYDQYQRHGIGRWAVITRAEQRFIGWCGLKQHSNGLVDLGFRFYASVWGRGYATEAAQASLQYGHHQLGIKRIVGRASSDNLASHRILEKIGMKRLGTESVEGIGLSVIYESNVSKQATA